MYSLISALIVIACVCLVLVVLVQNSKGGGLAANFSSSNQILGVRKTADFLEKSTWTLASALVVLCLVAAIINISSSDEGSTDPMIQTTPAPDPNALPFSAPAPATPATPTTPAN